VGNVSEIQQAKKWIYDSLIANADILAAVSTCVYADYNPRTLPERIFPYIIYNYLGGTDVDALGTARLFSEPLFQVRVVCEGHPTTSVRLVEKRIDDVLQVARYELSGDWYFTSRREQPVDRTEEDSATGRRFHNLGGIYRLWIGTST